MALQADQRLMTAEGYGLERLVGKLYEERGCLGLGDFSLSARIQGWWDSRDTEIDLVALDEPSQRLRLGSCKRSEQALVKDLANDALIPPLARSAQGPERPGDSDAGRG